MTASPVHPKTEHPIVGPLFECGGSKMNLGCWLAVARASWYSDLRTVAHALHTKNC